MNIKLKRLLWILTIGLIVFFSFEVAAFANEYDSEDNLHFMPWEFSVYEYPDITARRIDTFSSQYIKIIDSYEDGWAKISTYCGDYWAFLDFNRHIVTHTTGIFAYKNASIHEAVISPQIVVVRERHDDWLKIDTWLGERWLDLNFVPNTDSLDSHLSKFGNNIAAFYMNIETGSTYLYNPDTVYFSASITKALLALHIYQKAEKGETDLDEYITFTQADFWPGSGITRLENSVGDKFTQREVLRRNLMHSDNIATLMLRRVHGLQGYAQLVENLGAAPSRIGDRVMNSHIDVREAGAFMSAIYDYIESDGIYSSEFKQNLLDNQFPFMTSDYLKASKTGWNYPKAWHDMAIIYAPSPYILVILSRDRSGTSRDYQAFADISMMFQRFNDTWFSTSNTR